MTSTINGEGESRAQAIRALGTALGPAVVEQCRSLYHREQSALAATLPPLAAECAYGAHERHRLDLYAVGEGAEKKPILVFVHGGGFVLGDKGGVEHWANANVGRMAARQGFLGAVMNYRLAPDHPWPAGSEDVEAAVAWLGDNAARFGGDPTRIVLCGTSAGAVHISGYLKLAGNRPPIRGAILLSGLYGFTPLEPKDERYYGAAAQYGERMPRHAVIGTELPLLVAAAEYDPPRFQQEFAELLAERLRVHGQLPGAHVASGHGHYTMAMHLGTGDGPLADHIADFVRRACA